MEQRNFIRMQALSKEFFGTKVLSDVTLELRAGEVHGLVGENGAGKSTLMKIIAGSHRPSSGVMYVMDNVVQFSSPGEAYRAGIYLVQQEPSLFKQLSVGENIFMGLYPLRKPVIGGIDRRVIRKRAMEVLKALEIPISPDEKAGNLGIAHQQMLEIAKALVRDVKLLILDEPTAALSIHEVQLLFRIVGKLRDEGMTILFVSHRLEEVFELSDRVTVLRDGRLIGTFGRNEINQDQLVNLMVGREIALQKPRVPFVPLNRSPCMEVHDLCRTGKFTNVSFTLYPGEVVGMAGLVGAGRTEIAEVLSGVASSASGTIAIDQKPVVIKGVRDAIQHGIVYIPEDRHAHGVALSVSIFENITIPWLNGLKRFGSVSSSRQYDMAIRAAKRLDVRMRSVDQLVRELSGGNQQKIVISKWVQSNPRVIIFDEPTRGVDIGAKVEIHKIIEELAQRGSAILVISSDLLEILAVSDRVLVVREGKIAGEVQGDEMDEHTIMKYAAVGSSSEISF